MRINRPLYYPLIWIFALCLLIVAQSCQSDARNSTRIPPLVKKSKAQWQKDALLSLSEFLNRGIDQDVNYFKRARIYFEQDQYNEALADINEAIEEQENVGDYFLLRGKINREIGALDKALEDAQRAEALQQTSPELYVLLADILQAKGKFKDSGKYLSHAMQMAPYDGSAYYVKGMLEARQGDSLASLTSLNYAINVNPKLLRAYLQSSIINRKLHNYDQALVINNRAIKRFPLMSELYFERGEIYNTLSNADTALIYYQKAISLNPKYTDALSRKATIEIAQKYYYKAIASLGRLRRINPDYPKINNLLGYCYEKLGDYTKARELYTATLALDQDDRDARNGMWRMRSHGYDPTSYSGASEGTNYKSLDTTRVKINLIQPRKTTNLQVDSSRKAKIR